VVSAEMEKGENGGGEREIVCKGRYLHLLSKRKEVERTACYGSGSKVVLRKGLSRKKEKDKEKFQRENLGAW